MRKTHPSPRPGRPLRYRPGNYVVRDFGAAWTVDVDAAGSASLYVALPDGQAVLRFHLSAGKRGWITVHDGGAVSTESPQWRPLSQFAGLARQALFEAAAKGREDAEEETLAEDAEDVIGRLLEIRRAVGE